METSGGDRAKRLMSLSPRLLISSSPPLSRSKSVCPSLALRIYETSPFFFPMLLSPPPPFQSSKEFSGTMTLWLFLISFALPLPLRRCHQQTFLCRLPLPPRKRQKQCNILMQHRAKLCQSLRRDSAAERNQAEVTRGTRNGPIFASWRCQTGKRQQRLFRGCDLWRFMTSLNYLYPVFFFLILLCRRMHSCLAPCFWWTHQCYLNPVNKHQEEFMPWDAECHCSVKPLDRVWSPDLKFSILRGFRESWLSQTCFSRSWRTNKNDEVKPATFPPTTIPDLIWDTEPFSIFSQRKASLPEKSASREVHEVAAS